MSELEHPSEPPTPPPPKWSRPDLLKIAAFVLLAVAMFGVGRLYGHYVESKVVSDPARQEQAAETALRHGDDQTAFALFSKLAPKGNVAAAYHLGDLYEHGIGTARDEAKAKRWLVVAADHGNVAAARQLGLLYLQGVATVQDFTQARKWLAKAADAGDELALRRLGDMNRDGLGAPADPVAAYACYEAAAMHGNSYAVSLRDQLSRSLSVAQQRQAEKKARQLLARIASATPAAPVPTGKPAPIAPEPQAS